MAPTFRAGHDIDVLVDEKDLSPFLNDFTVSASLDPLETTNFDSGGNREYIKGLGDATVALEGMYAVTSDSTNSTDDLNVFLDEALGGSTQVVVTITPEPGTTGGRAFMFQGDITGYDISGAVDGLVDTSVDIQASGGSRAYQSGVMLRQVGTTGNPNTAVDSGLANGGSTGGGVAHFHVVSISGTTGVSNLTVQHSTTGSTWVNLVSLNNQTAANVSRSTVSGTIKEQLRANVGTTGVVSAVIAFARFGSPKK